jgi:ABC-type uncharacterized transport system substrate-binding protein
MKISLNDFGPLISDKKIGDEIYQIIKKSLLKEKKIEIDFSEITSMATFCAKQIFGKLYIELGSSQFFERIKFQNTNEDLQIIIKMGIQNALDEER